MPNWTFEEYKTKNGGRKIWYGRSRQPFRQPDGSIRYRTVERSLGTSSIQEARERARTFDLEYAELANRPLPRTAEEVKKRGPMTFADAVGIYVKSGNPARFLAPIVRVIGLKPAAEITQEDALEVVARVYPNATATTTNRQVWTPISAVLRFNNLMPTLKRPKGHDKLPTVDKTDLPPEGWFDAVFEHMTPRLRALMLLINLHGLRISEALLRRPEDLDTKRWILTLPDTKDGKPYQILLSEPVVDSIKAMLAARSEVNRARVKAGKEPLPEQKWLFGTRNRSNIRRDIHKACAKADVKTYGTHMIGRHSFATAILEEGKSLPYLQTAGRWASLKAVARYAHLAKSEVAEEVRDLGRKWHERRKKGEVVPLRRKGKPQ